MASRLKPLKAGLTEKQVSEQVVQAAAMFGVELRRRNVGGCYNAGGRYVAFGSPGDSDYYATLPGGRCLELEVKRGDFDPRRALGAARERFRRQLGRLERTNADGGVGLWVNDASQLLDAMPAILAVAGIVYDDDGFPYLDRRD